MDLEIRRNNVRVTLYLRYVSQIFVEIEQAKWHTTEIPG